MRAGLSAIRYVLVVLVALICSLLSYGANAACKFTSGGAQMLNIPVTSVLTVPRDAPVGTVIYTSPYVTPPPTGQTSCNNDPFGVQNRIGSQPGSNATSFPIGNTGLSFVWKYIDIDGTYSWPSYGGAGNGGGSVSMPNGFQLVKTGPISAGATVPGGTAAILAYGGLSLLTMVFSNSIIVNQTACTTPNVTVPLGTHNLSELGAVGATTSPVAFSIALNSCPAGMNTIKYQIDPTTTVLNSANSVVAFDSGSVASGAGVQLLDGSGNVLPLSKQAALSGYASSTGGNYVIPLKARYYRTGSTLKAGTANTSMTFTINYQ